MTDSTDAMLRTMADEMALRTRERDAALAEIEKLTAEIERLRAIVANREAVDVPLRAELAECQAEFGPEFRNTPLIECIRMARGEARSMMRQRDDAIAALLEERFGLP